MAAAAEAALALATLVLRVIGAQACRWPRPPKLGVRRVPVAARNQPPRRAVVHGARPSGGQVALAARCHSTHRVFAGVGDTIFCAKCGSYTASCRLANLATACRGAPCPGGATTRLARLLAGRPVVAGGCNDVPTPPTLLRTEAGGVGRPPGTAVGCPRLVGCGGSGAEPHAASGSGSGAVGASAAGSDAYGDRRGQMRPHRPAQTAEGVCEGRAAAYACGGPDGDACADPAGAWAHGSRPDGAGADGAASLWHRAAGGWYAAGSVATEDSDPWLGHGFDAA